MQVLDLGRHDRPAASVDPDMTGAALGEQPYHTFEELEVTTLIGVDRDRIPVLLDSGRRDLVHRPVVAQVNDLSTL